MEQAKLALSAAALAAQTILECSGEIYRRGDRHPHV